MSKYARARGSLTRRRQGGRRKWRRKARRKARRKEGDELVADDGVAMGEDEEDEGCDEGRVELEGG